MKYMYNEAVYSSEADRAYSGHGKHEAWSTHIKITKTENQELVNPES